MGDSVTPEILGNMIRQYFSQERPEEEAIQALNHLRRVLHEVSPFAQEPVDCVLWVKADEVVANDYNPNVMAPGEKKLNRPGFPGECFICELRLPDHRFRWKHNKLFLLLPEEYGPAFPAIVDCYTSPPT